MLLSSDTAIRISKSMGLAQISFAECFDELKPDLLVVLGDRYEIFCAASATMVRGFRSPTSTRRRPKGIRRTMRHGITKMTHRFTAAEPTAAASSNWESTQPASSIGDESEHPPPSAPLRGVRRRRIFLAPKTFW